MEIRFCAVDNHSADRLLRKVVETQPEYLSLEHDLKGIRALARRLPIQPKSVHAMGKAKRRVAGRSRLLHEANPPGFLMGFDSQNR